MNSYRMNCNEINLNKNIIHWNVPTPFTLTSLKFQLLLLLFFNSEFTGISGSYMATNLVVGLQP